MEDPKVYKFQSLLQSLEEQQKELFRAKATDTAQQWVKLDRKIDKLYQWLLQEQVKRENLDKR